MRFEPRRPAAAAAADPLLLPKQHLQKPLAPPACDGNPADGPPEGHPAAGWCSPWLTAASFGFLTFNSAMAAHRSRGDRGAIAFVAFSYLDLLAMFLCLHLYEGARPGSPLRGRLKVAIWLLTTAITLAFSSRVAAVMPVAAAAVAVWLVASGTVAGGLYALFFCTNDKQ